MPYFKRNQFYEVQPPVTCIKNHKINSWFIVDKNDVIIAENLTQGTAESIELSLNHVENVITILKGLYDHEKVVAYRTIDDLKDHDARNEIVKMQYELLNVIGFDVKWINAQDPDKVYWDFMINLMKNQRAEHRRKKKQVQMRRRILRGDSLPGDKFDA